MTDPVQELLAHLGAEIKRMEAQAVADIEQYGYGDREYAQQRWAEFTISVEPVRRQREYILKQIATIEAVKMPGPIVVINANAILPS